MKQVESEPAAPEIHAAATRMAGRFVWIIQAILRDEERGLALEEAYRVAREGLEEFRRGGTPGRDEVKDG